MVKHKEDLMNKTIRTHTFIIGATIFLLMALTACMKEKNDISGTWVIKKYFVSRISTFSYKEAAEYIGGSLKVDSGVAECLLKNKEIKCKIRKTMNTFSLKDLIDYKGRKEIEGKYKNLDESSRLVSVSMNCGETFIGNSIEFTEDFEYAFLGWDGAVFLLEKQK
jgi:hypothetical protein